MRIKNTLLRFEAIIEMKLLHVGMNTSIIMNRHPSTVVFLALS